MQRTLSMCVAAALVVGCGSDPRGQGEECFASSECGPGLVCDLAAEPAVCTGMGSNLPQPDAAPGPDPVFDAAPVPDAGPRDPDAAPSPPDAAPSLPDAAPPDAAPPDAAI